MSSSVSIRKFPRPNKKISNLSIRGIICVCMETLQNFFANEVKEKKFKYEKYIKIFPEDVFCFFEEKDKINDIDSHSRKKSH
jgi:hypothetical protein